MTLSTEPPFWNDYLHQVPLCCALRQNFSEIQREIRSFIDAAHPFMAYPKYANLYTNTWDAFPLSKFQNEFAELSEKNLNFNLDRIVAFTRSRLPTLSGLISDLEQEGHLSNLFVSRLLPGSVINPHRGWTPDFLRIHLALYADPYCRITVGQETRTWVEGELLAFKDGGPYLHQVRHDGTTERIILSLDLSLNYLEQFIPEISRSLIVANPAGS
ncbi:Aspartyl/asparaginy/proline hydroxylase [Burkholderiaceae bacterium]